MADCCNEIRAELAALRAEVAKLKPVDEQRIIRTAITGAEGSIIPQIAGIAASAFAGLISPFNARLGGVEAKIPDALSKAREALERAYQAKDAAGAATATANNAAGQAAKALAAIAALAASIAAALLAIAALQVLGSRIDSLENRVDSLSNAISNVLGLLNPIKQQAQRAENKADTANDRANKADATANGAAGQAGRATEIANEAIRQAQAANAKAESAATAANEAKKAASAADKKAEEAKKIAVDTRAFVQPLPGQIEKADQKATEANRKAQDAISKAQEAIGKADTAKKQADDANRKAEEAKKAIPPLEKLANQAKKTADEALNKINNFLKNPPKGLKGDPGAKGKDGAKGADGKDGKDGINGITQFIYLPGKDGRPGKDGLPGISGRPGRDGKNGKDGINGKDAPVDKESNALIKQIARNAAFIPALVARPTPLTSNQTIDAAAAGTCRTTQPGGCSNKLVNDAANGVTNSANKRFDALDAFNASANAGQLVLLKIINKKLGDEIFGGISGKLIRTSQWLHLDRALNVLTFAATIHNAAQLSSALGETLIGALSNVLQLIGLKADDGSPFDIKSVIQGTFENLIKGIIGAENYTQLTQTWAKANRIYQATTNVLNSFQNIASTILNGLEIVAGNVGKIGNALRKAGEVLETAYGWMNPQPKFNRITQTLENLNTAGSTVQQVTQVPLDIISATTELQNANTELVKAIKEDGDPKNKGTEAPEPDVLKAKETVSKAVSVGANLTDTDKEED